jgi:hypothetical protein
VNSLRLTSVDPASGVAGTSVTFAGTGFGPSQGSGGAVWLGSMAGQVVSWSDTEVVAAVAPGARSGVAKIQQNGVWSNAKAFLVPAPGGNTLTPALLNLAVGDTRTLQALNATGQPATALTWTSSDPAVVSLSSEDPPVLTALAAGHVTITAGTATADVTVWAGALPVGTVLWSNPGNGSGVTKIVPAVPSPSGVADVFAFQNDGTVQAITADGTTAWTAGAEWYKAMPDFQGGLIVANSDPSGKTASYAKLDGITGIAYPAYVSQAPDGGCQFGDSSGAGPNIHPDGTIFMIEGCTVILVDSLTGKKKFTVPLVGLDAAPDPSSRQLMGMIIAGDGYAYVVYSYLDNGWWDYDGGQPEHVMAVRVNTSGVYDTIKVLDFLVASPDDDFVLTGDMITNADQGIVITWSAPEPGGWKAHMVVTTGASASEVSVPTTQDDVGVVPMLQLQDGSFVGTTDDGGSSMIAFDGTGKVRWSVPGYYCPKIATADGGVIAQIYDPDNLICTGPAVTFDQNGNATGQMASLPTFSWKGAYRIGSTEAEVPEVDLAKTISTSQTATPGGNLTGNGFALSHQTFGLVFCGQNTGDDGGTCNTKPATPDVTFSYQPGIDDTNYMKAREFAKDYQDWYETIKRQASHSYWDAFIHLPAIVSHPVPSQLLIGGPNKVTKFMHTVYVDGHWMTRTEYPRNGDPIKDPEGKKAAAVPPNGWTRNSTDFFSWAYYLPIMGQAQIALACASGSCKPTMVSPQYPPTDDPSRAQFKELIPAIGQAIGAIAAHETAHQFIVEKDYLMDCYLDSYSEHIQCESRTLYEAEASDGATHPWNYTDAAINPDTNAKAHMQWGSKVAKLMAKRLFNLE